MSPRIGHRRFLCAVFVTLSTGCHAYGPYSPYQTHPGYYMPPAGTVPAQGTTYTPPGNGMFQPNPAVQGNPQLGPESTFPEAANDRWRQADGQNNSSGASPNTTIVPTNAPSRRHETPQPATSSVRQTSLKPTHPQQRVICSTTSRRQPRHPTHDLWKLIQAQINSGVRATQGMTAGHLSRMIVRSNLMNHRVHRRPSNPSVSSPSVANHETIRSRNRPPSARLWRRPPSVGWSLEPSHLAPDRRIRSLTMRLSTDGCEV